MDAISECADNRNLLWEHTNEDETEDTSSSDLKWDSMSMTSGQSATETTRFDTIEDVSHAIGNIS